MLLGQARERVEKASDVLPCRRLRFGIVAVRATRKRPRRGSRRRGQRSRSTAAWSRTDARCGTRRGLPRPARGTARSATSACDPRARVDRRRGARPSCPRTWPPRRASDARSTGATRWREPTRSRAALDCRARRSHEHHHRREREDDDGARHEVLPRRAVEEGLRALPQAVPVEGLQVGAGLLVHRVLASFGQGLEGATRSARGGMGVELARSRCAGIQCAVQPHLDAHLEVFAAFHVGPVRALESGARDSFRSFFRMAEYPRHADPAHSPHW
jgi:hypothetical protein